VAWLGNAPAAAPSSLSFPSPTRSQIPGRGGGGQIRRGGPRVVAGGAVASPRQRSSAGRASPRAHGRGREERVERGGSSVAPAPLPPALSPPPRLGSAPPRTAVMAGGILVPPSFSLPPPPPPSPPPFSALPALGASLQPTSALAAKLHSGGGPTVRDGRKKDGVGPHTAV